MFFFFYCDYSKISYLRVNYINNKWELTELADSTLPNMRHP